MIEKDMVCPTQEFNISRKDTFSLKVIIHILVFTTNDIRKVTMEIHAPHQAAPSPKILRNEPITAFLV